jgi:hypothetical protein
VAALGSRLPRQAAATQLDFDSASRPVKNSELSPAPEPAAEFLSFRNLKLASPPETESKLSPAPDPAAQILSWREEPNPVTPFEVRSERESASQLDLESRSTLETNAEPSPPPEPAVQLLS